MAGNRLVGKLRSPPYISGRSQFTHSEKAFLSKVAHGIPRFPQAMQSESTTPGDVAYSNISDGQAPVADIAPISFSTPAQMLATACASATRAAIFGHCAGIHGGRLYSKSYPAPIFVAYATRNIAPISAKYVHCDCDVYAHRGIRYRSFCLFGPAVGMI